MRICSKIRRAAIESYFRARGYRDAAAPYTRQERAGELIITFKVTRGPRYLVRGVSVAGNAGLPTTQLTELIRLKEGEPFVRAALALSVGAIENLYHASGFTRAQIKAADTVVVAPQDKAAPDRLVDITVAIVEGPRTEVRSVTFQGNMAMTEAEIRKVISTAPGRVYSALEVVIDRDAIAQAYHNRGFESVVVTPQPAFAENDTRADVRFSIVEGPQIIVDHVIIAGNRRISTQTIEQEVVLREGEPFGEAAVVQSRANLNALELFRRVQIEALAPSGGTRRDVLVTVEEAPSTSVDVGGGVEGSYIARPTGEGGVAQDRFQLTPRGSFAVSRRNLWGKNRSITVATRVALRTRDTQQALLTPTRSQRTDSEQLRIPRISRADLVSRATGVSHHGRDRHYRHHRAGHPFQLRLQPSCGPGSARQAPLSALHGNWRLLVSAHETLQHQSHGRRRGMAHRSVVPAGAGVEVLGHALPRQP